PGAGASLPPVPLEIPAPGPAAQVLLPRPIPTPALEYRGDGGFGTVEAGPRPLLILLFGSWCPNCQEELRRFAGHADRIRAAGLDVLALAVDGLDEAGLGSLPEAAELLRQVGWPHMSGAATPQLLGRMQHLSDALFELRTPFAVPWSFLLGPERDLIAIYRGPVPLETLVSDTSLVNAEAPDRRDRSVPFPGKWYTLHPGRAALLELLADHFQSAFPGETVRYLEQALPLLGGVEAGPVRVRIGKLRLYLGGQALAAGKNAEAAEQYRAALRLGPASARTHHDLGIALYNQGRLQEAEAAFLKSLELAPGNPSATRNLEQVRRAMRGGR
ncbi:MAG: tetratricopeptide repeat protein, partial [Akkermansiaceae bacterium]|nr:tetratricopeptide repeat protein [Akkermansiaceae bacterium]